MSFQAIDHQKQNQLQIIFQNLGNIQSQLYEYQLFYNPQQYPYFLCLSLSQLMSLYNRVVAGKNKQGEQEKPGSQPIFNQNNIFLRNPQQNYDSNSSNYFTMQNVSHPEGSRNPSVNMATNHQQQQINHPLRINSNLLQTPIQIRPLINQKPLANTPISQFHIANSPNIDMHNYQLQYFELKKAHSQLLQAQNQVVLQLDLARQQLKIAKNNQEYLSRRNFEQVDQIKKIRGKLLETERELIATRAHKEDLFRQVQSNKQNQPHIIYPSVNSYSAQTNTLNYGAPSSLHHQNQHLLYQIQQYQATILYKNTQIERYQIESNNHLFQIQTLKHENHQLKNNIKLCIERQERQNAINSELQSQKNSMTADLSILSVLRAQCDILKKEKKMLETKANNLILDYERSVRDYHNKSKENEEQIAQLKKLNQNLKDKIGYLQRPKIYTKNEEIQVQIPHYAPFIDPRVPTYYIGDDFKNYNGASKPLGNNFQSFDEINRAFSQNLSKSLSLHQQPQRDCNYDNAAYYLGNKFIDPNGIKGFNNNKTLPNPDALIYNFAQNTIKIPQAPEKIISSPRSKQSFGNSMKIQDEGFFDFGKQMEETIKNQGTLHREQSRGAFNLKNPENLYIQERPDQKTTFCGKLNKKAPQLKQNQVSKREQLQQKKGRRVIFEEPHSILKYPQLPFRGQSQHRLEGERNKSFDQKYMVREKRRQQEYIGLDRGNMTQNNILVRQNNRKGVDYGSYYQNSKRPAGKQLSSKQRFEQKIIQLMRENRELKRNLRMGNTSMDY